METTSWPCSTADTIIYRFAERFSELTTYGDAYILPAVVLAKNEQTIHCY